MSKKKPDQVAWDEEKQKYVAAILPYATSVSSPAITPDNIDDWKLRGVGKVNKQIETKFYELRDEYNRLIDELNWNELVYTSKFAFEPVIGETYHLFVGKDEKPFLSLIGPSEWNRPHLGSFRLNSEQKWIKLD